MTNYLYSVKNNAFFPTEFIDAYSDFDLSDAVEVEDSVYLEFINPPDGMIRVPGDDGLPAWGKIPPPTKEQLIEQAEAEKQRRIDEVHTETEMLRAKLALKRIRPDEEAMLIAWLDYLDLLEAIDTTIAPDIDWPQKPQ